MNIQELKINGVKILDATNKIDWSVVKNTPTIYIASNTLVHTARYYTFTEVDSRIASLKTAVDNLTAKINAL
jgi:hypothetical protein